MKKTTLIAFVVLGATSLAVGVAMAAPGDARGALAFEELDANADGQLTREEMSVARQKRFESIDANGDGNLSLEELQAQAQERAKKRAERMIERRDANGDGVLSSDEIGSGDRAERRFDKVDGDGDGVISKAEFDDARERFSKRHGKKSRN